MKMLAKKESLQDVAFVPSGGSNWMTQQGNGKRYLKDCSIYLGKRGQNKHLFSSEYERKVAA